MTTLRLPEELLDHIADNHLQGLEVFRNCCLVSKSWVPRTRRQLFYKINFATVENLRSWKEIFPDPSTSPAQYANTLFFRCLQVAGANVEAGDWITGFSRVAHLGVMALEQYPSISSSRIVNLIFSFPLLEDLTVMTGYSALADDGDGPDRPPTTHPPTPPLTGCLRLYQHGGMKPITRRLLSLPGGVHFRRLVVEWYREEDIMMTMALVEACSDTLEALDITYRFILESSSASIDFSRLKATKLKDIAFRADSRGVGWITMALKTIPPEYRDLRQITIFVPCLLSVFGVSPTGGGQPSMGDAVCDQWLDLDYFLAKFWETRSIRPRVICPKLGDNWQNTVTCLGSLLTEITGREIIDLVEYLGPQYHL